MATSGSKVIKKANSYLGKGGSFVWKYYGLASGTAWCCAFVSYIMMKAGAKKLFCGGTATFYVPTAQAWLKKNCKQVKMADAKAGDIVIFTWDGNGYNSERGSRDHIGFIRKKGTSSTAYTIEGNTSGSIVANRTRPSRYIYGIYRPNYTSSSSESSTSTAYPTKSLKKGSTGTQVKKLQKCLNKLIGAGLTVDGDYGTATYKAVIAFQKKYGLTQDGIVGTKTLAKIKSLMS